MTVIVIVLVIIVIIAITMQMLHTDAGRAKSGPMGGCFASITKTARNNVLVVRSYKMWVLEGGVAHMYMYMYIYTCLDVYIYRYINMCMYMCVCIYRYT